MNVVQRVEVYCASAKCEALCWEGYVDVGKGSVQ